MSDVAALARPIAALAVLVRDNDPPDMLEIDSKEKLFGATLRLQLDKLLALLCARLRIAAPTVVKRTGPAKMLLQAVASHFGWRHNKPQPMFTASDGNQARKMEKWLEKATCDEQAVEQIAEKLLVALKGSEKGSEHADEGEEEEEEAFGPGDAMATMREVSVAHAATEKDKGSDTAKNAAAGSDDAMQKTLVEAEAADAAEEAPAAGSSSVVLGKKSADAVAGMAEEVDSGAAKGGSGAAVGNVVAEAAKAAAAGSGGGASDEVLADAGTATAAAGGVTGEKLPDAAAKPVAAAGPSAARVKPNGEEKVSLPPKEKVAEEESKVVVAGARGALPENVLLDNRKWKFIGHNWVTVRNGLKVCGQEHRDGVEAAPFSVNQARICEEGAQRCYCGCRPLQHQAFRRGAHGRGSL
jgi:hypothetical protein